MSIKHLGYLAVTSIVTSILILVTNIPIAPLQQLSSPSPTPSGHVATPEEIAAASIEWASSAHKDTYDGGLGADTTCARCKSPRNWDPTQDFAAIEALDCYSCKRIPGAERPNLDQGVTITPTEWLSIPCDICHIPQGNSYDTGIAYWNQALGQYEPVESKMELCAKCHEGQHGFEVVEEQKASIIHTSLDCTDCHGNHGGSSACVDCHDPATGSGALEHAQHTNVNCTACHDRSGLSIWFDQEPDSRHFGEYVTRRFAHTLTSWPSHNLSTEVNCLKCHHLRDSNTPATVPDINCRVCHVHADGAVQFWCTDFPRDPSP